MILHLVAFVNLNTAVLKPTDENTKKLLDGYVARNGDCWSERVYVKYDRDTITAKTLSQLEATEELVYSNASFYPFMFKDHFKQTCFKDFEGTTYYQKFRVDQDLIHIENLDRHTITLDQYVELAMRRIDDNIKAFLDTYDKFYLAYSQGIDSIMLMAAIMYYDRVRDCTLLTIKNQWYDESTSGPWNFDKERSLGFNTEKLIITQKDFLDTLKHKGAVAAWNYQHHAMEGFSDKILYGHEGNSVLMHKWEWLKHIGYQGDVNDQYCSIDQQHYDSFDDSLAAVYEQHGHEMPSLDYLWYTRVQHDSRPCKLNIPIADQELMRMLPFIDHETIRPDFIKDAQLVRMMTHHYVGDLLDQTIVSSDTGWINVPDGLQSGQMIQYDRDLIPKMYYSRNHSIDLEINMHRKWLKFTQDGLIPRQLLSLKLAQEIVTKKPNHFTLQS